MFLPLRVGVDCDGVLSNTFPAWVRHYGRADHAHEDMDRVLNPRKWIHPKDTCESCFREVINSPEVTMDCDMYEGAPAWITFLFAYADLHFITHRGASVEQATKSWLAKHDILDAFDAFNFGRANKAEYCLANGLEFHIDDSPTVAAEFAELGDWALSAPKLLLIDRPYNQGAPAYKRFSNLAGDDGAARYLIGIARERNKRDLIETH